MSYIKKQIYFNSDKLYKSYINDYNDIIIEEANNEDES